MKTCHYLFLFLCFVGCSQQKNLVHTIGSSSPITKLKYPLDSASHTYLEIIQDHEECEYYLTKEVGKFIDTHGDRILEISAQIENNLNYLHSKILRGKQKLLLNAKEFYEIIEALQNNQKVELQIGNLKTTIEIEPFLEQYRLLLEKNRN